MEAKINQVGTKIWKMKLLRRCQKMIAKAIDFRSHLEGSERLLGRIWGQIKSECIGLCMFMCKCIHIYVEVNNKNPTYVVEKRYVAGTLRHGRCGKMEAKSRHWCYVAGTLRHGSVGKMEATSVPKFKKK